MADDYEAQERERIVAASGSGGSAQGWPPGMAGPRFDQDVFGGAGAALQDDDGNPLVAKKCLETKIDKVVFDRNGFPYHGRISAVADAARKAGLKF